MTFGLLGGAYGSVRGDQSSRACGIVGDARPVQVQHVRDPARCDGSVCSGGCVRVPRARGKHEGEFEGRETHKDACEIGAIGASRAYNLGSV